MLMPADRKHLFAPTVSGGFSSWPGTEWTSLSQPPSLPLPKASVAPLGFCCMMGYIQLPRLAGLEECWGCAPSHQLVSGARRNIKAASRRGREGGWKGHVSLDRAGGHWACHMADGWFTTPVERWGLVGHLSLPPQAHTFHWQISFTVYHLDSALSSMNINKLSVEPSLQPRFSWSTCIDSCSSQFNCSLSLAPLTSCLCQCFSHMFVFLSIFCHLQPFPVIPRDVTLTHPAFAFSHCPFSVMTVMENSMPFTLLFLAAHFQTSCTKDTWVFCVAFKDPLSIINK